MEVPEKRAPIEVPDQAERGPAGSDISKRPLKWTASSRARRHPRRPPVPAAPEAPDPDGPLPGPDAPLPAGVAGRRRGGQYPPSWSRPREQSNRNEARKAARKATSPGNGKSADVATDARLHVRAKRARRSPNWLPANAHPSDTSAHEAAPPRPSCIVSAGDVPEISHRYPNSDEPMAPSRAIGKAAGLLRIGLHVTRVPPGHRTSWPHAEEDEEEFVYVLEGELDASIDGQVHRMRAGNLAAFPAGTGISHTFLNEGPAEAVILVGGEAAKKGSRIFYSKHPGRRAGHARELMVEDVPKQELGPHEGAPRTPRK